MRKILAILGLLSTPVSVAFAGTEQDAYEKLWSKYAAEFDGKPKIACVCTDGGANTYRLGTVMKFAADQATCYLPTFNGEGTVVGQTPCIGTFSTLAK